jgi:hypothetical protein
MAFKHGDIVEIIPGAKFVDGTSVPASQIGIKLFVRGIQSETTCSIGTQAAGGRALGIINMDNLRFYEEISDDFNVYTILTTKDTLTKESPNIFAKDKITLPKYGLYSIIGEENGYGRLVKNYGWVDLEEVRRI